MRVLALTKYGMRGASARQRYMLYRDRFAAAGIELTFSPFLTDDYVAALSRGRRSRAGAAAGAFARRLRALATEVPRADAVWLQYESFAYGPAALERLLFALGRPVVVDYDDAIFHNYDDADSWLVRRLLGNKLGSVIAQAAAVTAGNPYLAAYARRWNDRVIEVPTVVDTDTLRPARRRSLGAPVIGWIGSPSTWRYVRPLLPMLRELTAAGSARVLVVGAGARAQQDYGGGLEFREWDMAREVEDLQEMDIGIMPVPDEPWERGKCGYKLVQYMAVGIPSIASPVGINRAMIVNGETGFLAPDVPSWRVVLARLLDDAELRSRLGDAARRRSLERYSLAAQAPRLIELFRSLPRN